jgi:hypothetical protein
MGYFAPELIKYFDAADGALVLQAARDFCLTIMQGYASAPLRDHAEILHSTKLDNKSIGSIAALPCFVADVIGSKSFREIVWRVEWASGHSSLFSITLRFGDVASVMIKYDFLNETGGPSSEADFKTVARIMAEKMRGVVFVSSNGFYGSPAAIYFEMAHCRKGNEAIAGTLPVFTEFAKSFETKWLGAPSALRVSHSKVDKWFAKVTARLAGHQVRRSWWFW